MVLIEQVKEEQWLINTKHGKVEAPDWYRNSKGEVPSTMQAGLTKEAYERQVAMTKRKEAQQLLNVLLKRQLMQHSKNVEMLRKLTDSLVKT